MKSFEELECWKSCRMVRLKITEIRKLLPKHEDYALNDNMKRAAYSTTNNIAEGYGRFHYQENIQFCRYSRGSLFEFKDQLIVCLDEKYINKELFEEAYQLIDKSLAILNGYINYLKSMKIQND